MRETKEYVIAQTSLPGFDLKATETKVLDFDLPAMYNFEKSLADMGGVLAAPIGKVGRRVFVE